RHNHDTTQPAPKASSTTARFTTGTTSSTNGAVDDVGAMYTLWKACRLSSNIGTTALAAMACARMPFLTATTHSRKGSIELANRPMENRLRPSPGTMKQI